MKTFILPILVIPIAIGIGIVSASFIIKEKTETEPLLKTKTITQVAIVVKDLDKVRKAWAQTLGIAIPEISIAEGHSSRPTQYKHEPSNAKAKLAFISMDNIQIELIQPMGGKSTWQEFLDAHGEGIHHIAFAVKDINGMEKLFDLQGMPTVQSGGWDGGAYSYVDATGKMGCILELLEEYKK
jgi:methylmalonyl-CoA/ethylmalonyl-CoA epimerase